MNITYKHLTKQFKTINKFRTIPANLSHPKRKNSWFYSSHKQDKTLSLRVTLENFSILSKLAAKHNVSVSQLVRDLIADGMSKEMIASYKYALSKSDQSSLQHIESYTHRMSSNMNQLAMSNNYFNKKYSPYDLVDDPLLLKKHDRYDQDIIKLIDSFNQLTKKVNKLSRLSQK